MKVGIMGTGAIAVKLADTMVRCDERVVLTAVASRTFSKAQAFASNYDIKAYGSYQELCRDNDIDLIYVATPMSEHKANMLLAIKGGKAVLCEKAFTVNAKEAEEVLKAGAEKGVLVAEAIWTRYMPSRAIITNIIKEGKIGKIRSINANLGYFVIHKSRITDPLLGGGILLDCGVYPLNFALMANAGAEVEALSGLCIKGESGVDLDDSMSLTFDNGVIASLQSTALNVTDRRGLIYGSEGTIEVQNVNNPEVINVYSADRTPVLKESIKISHEVNGYEYQLYACARALEEGKREVEEMPHEEILRVMRLMDRFRSLWGVRLAGEKQGPSFERP